MLSLDQIQRELRAIEEFDAWYALAGSHRPDEIIGSICRAVRKHELLDMVEEKVLNN